MTVTDLKAQLDDLLATGLARPESTVELVVREDALRLVKGVAHSTAGYHDRVTLYANSTPAPAAIAKAS